MAEFIDLDTQEPMTLTLVLPHDADIDGKRISSLAPDWNDNAGICRRRYHQVECAGRVETHEDQQGTCRRPGRARLEGGTNKNPATWWDWGWRGHFNKEEVSF